MGSGRVLRSDEFRRGAVEMRCAGPASHDDPSVDVTFTHGRTTRTPYGHHPNETTNVCAIVALFASFIGLVPAAIVLAWIAIRETSRRPHEQGYGLAVAAIVITAVEIAAALVLLYNADLPPFGP